MTKDPLFNEIPWEFIYNDDGQLVGEVYLILNDRPAKERETVHETY